jgi:hypothetical protein
MTVESLLGDLLSLHFCGFYGGVRRTHCEVPVLITDSCLLGAAERLDITSCIRKQLPEGTPLPAGPLAN